MVPPQRSRRVRGRLASIDTDALYRAVAARGVEQSMSMRQLAVEIGVSNSLLSRLRSGRVPDTQRFMSIVRYLDLPAEHFVADQHEAAGAAPQVL